MYKLNKLGAVIPRIGCPKMSPTILKDKGYRLFFFSREEERMHVQVSSPEGEAKFWLDPHIELANNYRYSSRRLKEIHRLIEDHYSELVHAWQNHFGN